MRIFIFAVALLLCVASPRHAASQALTGRAIMEKNDRQNRVADEKAHLTMELSSKKGKKRTREIVMMRKTGKDGTEKMLIRFLAPRDVKGTGLLTHEQKNRDDDQWLYLPALRKVRRISASNKTDSFVGSDFTYEDLRPEKLDHFRYTLLREDSSDGTACYVIEAIPTDAREKKESGYSKRELWIRADLFVTLRVNFYDKKGKLLKTLEAGEIKPIAGTDKWRAHRVEMKNLKTGHRTVLSFHGFEINTGLPDNQFTRRYLERGR